MTESAKMESDDAIALVSGMLKEQCKNIALLDGALSPVTEMRPFPHDGVGVTFGAEGRTATAHAVGFFNDDGERVCWFSMQPVLPGRELSVREFPSLSSDL